MQFNNLFPSLRGCSRVGARNGDNQTKLYDVKFFPYPTDSNDQIFAVTGGRETIVYRPSLHPDRLCEIVRWFTDEDEDASLNSLAWTVDPVTTEPLICVAGETPKHIKILSVKTGRTVKALSGHGKDINDLAISPLLPTILASASADVTIRLWNLDPAYEKHPCAAIFHGEGHKQAILAISFHQNGRWLISGGMEGAICLWRVPDVPDSNAGTDKTTIVHYPYFYSTEIHPNFVDCVQFHGDLIFSRASVTYSEEKKIQPNTILLWKIIGFDSSASPPGQPPINSPGLYTRSSFSTSKPLFQRLLTFDTPDTSVFYLRFGLFHGVDMRPMLAMANEKSRFFFWDLQTLTEGRDPAEEAATFKKPGRGRKPKSRSSASDLSRLAMGREQSVASNSSGLPSASNSSAALAERKYDIGDPFTPLSPHKTVVATTHAKKGIFTRQIAWSNDGKWCVGVGDCTYMCIFYRGG